MEGRDSYIRRMSPPSTSADFRLARGEFSAFRLSR
jgi:hypothetical protein